MGMTIDEAIKALKWFMEYNEEDYYVGDRFQDEYGDWFYKVSERDFKAFRQAVDTMRKYQMFQDQSLSLYMERLKADMVATLTDIQSEFKEGLRCKGCCNNCVNACEDIPAGWFLDFIDAKINSLKENTDGTNSD